MTTNMDAVPSLLPCPFCGSSKVGMASEHDSDTGGVFLSVKCSGCRASSGAGFSTDPCPQTYQEVRDEWNRRAPTPAVQAEAVRMDGSLTRELLETLQMMVLHFTKTPSTLADSKARGKAHEVITKAYAQIGYASSSAGDQS
jgi:Lar family restriction alleviation protein